MKFVARPMYNGSNILNASEIDTLLAGKSDTGHAHAWSEITSKPSTFTPSAHTHAISDVTNLQAALDGKQASDADLTAIAGLAGTSGLLKKTAANAWSLDTSTYLTGNQSISLSGDASGSGTTSIAVTLANSGVTAGTYNDSATAVRPFTVDAKGRITSIGTAVTIAPAWGSVTGKPTTFTPAAHVLATTSALGAEHTVSGLTAGQVLKATGATTAKFEAVAWSEVTSKPTTFTPATHSHAISDVTNLQTTLDGKAASSHSHAWSEITSKPTTFTPAAHVLATTSALGAEHTVSGLTAGMVLKATAATTAKFEAVAWGEVTGKPTTFAPSTHTHLWADITDKPTTFTPATHSHAISDVTNLQTTLDGKQASDADLTAIAGLSGTSGLLKKTAANSWSLDTSTYLTGNQSISLSGDATGSGATSISVTLANTGVTAGTYNNAWNSVRPFTVDAKGRITAIGTAVTIMPDWSNVTGKPLASVSASISTAGWYTIAQGSARTAGRFIVSDQTGSRHNVAVLLAAGSYGQLTVDCLQGLRYSTRTIAHARIIYSTADRTYGTYKLQVYLENPTFTVDVVQHLDFALNGGWSAWALVTPTLENLPSGYAEDSTARIDDITTQAGGATFSYLKANTGSFPWSGLTGVPSTFAPSSHSHAISDVTSLQTTLDGKQASDADLTAIAGLTGTSGYLKKTAANTWTLDTSTFASSSHSHAWSEITSKPTTFAPTAHVLATTSALGAEHTVSGLTAGQVLRASGATTAAFASIADGDLPSTIVRTSRSISAGVGLSGGGDLSANRTVSMGTPSTLTAATTNSASGTTHTHAVLGSSNPGAASSLLETDASGYLRIYRLGVNAAPVSYYSLTVSGDVDFASGIFYCDTVSAGGNVSSLGNINASTVGYDWSAITPNTGFENYGGVWSTFGVKRFGNLVSLKGLLKTNAAVSAGAVITTLVAAYRPSLQRMFNQLSSAGVARIDITSAGQVVLQTALASGVWFSMEIMYFTGG